MSVALYAVCPSIDPWRKPSSLAGACLSKRSSKVALYISIWDVGELMVSYITREGIEIEWTEFS